MYNFKITIVQNRDYVIKNVWAKINGLLTLIPYKEFNKINNGIIYIISLTNKNTGNELLWYISANNQKEAIKIAKIILEGDDTYIIHSEGVYNRLYPITHNIKRTANVGVINIKTNKYKEID